MKVVIMDMAGGSNAEILRKCLVMDVMRSSVRGREYL
jgi:hypothetical protein